MVQLRSYQTQLITDIRTELGNHTSLIAQAPTGAGKSKIFIAMAQMAAAASTTTLIVTESTKIFKQIAKEYPAITINPSSRVHGITPGATYIAMAQTLARRKELVNQFSALQRRLLIINDEAHIGTATKLLHDIPNAYRIGFTATPAWKWAKHLSELYTAIVCGPQVAELINGGYLSPYKHFARVAANMDALKLERGEFSEDSQEIAFESDKVYDAMVEDLRTIGHRKAIVFTSSIRHCNALQRAMVIRGIRSIAVHSAQEEAINTYGMREFESIESGVNLCISVGTLTKGFDYPPIDLVILMRATTSLPLYLQMIGRGSRVYPGKSLFTVADYGGNYSRHGLWNEDRDWNKLWLPSKTRQRDAVASVKNCPACEYIMPAGKIICPNCGHIMAPPVKDKVEDTQLIDVTHRIKGHRLSAISPEDLALVAKNDTIKRTYAIRVAKAREQQQPGFLLGFATAMGYKPQWVDHQVIPLEPIEFYDRVL